MAARSLERYTSARDLAAIRGFRYLDVAEVAELPIAPLVKRVQAVEHAPSALDPIEAAALLGTVEKPALLLNQVLDLYWSLAHEKTLGKSADQLRRWQNPRKKAINNLISVIGNKPIEAITRDDMLDFRQFWLERIESGAVTANTANKDLLHIGDVLKTVNRMKRLGLDLPLGDLAFKQGEAKTRPPFSVDWIRTRLLADGALSGLNRQARGILLGMINTGYRPSEGAALTRDTIRLEHAIPHISIEADGRQLKTSYARRIIPLTGASLQAFRDNPDGFPRYRNKDALSATVNKYLKENELLETPDHSLYSLRHAFEDRMLAAGIDDRIRRDVFGHRLTRERYGRGASLPHIAKLLTDIAL